MSDVIDSEGFRANVGIILMRGAGEVFLGRQVGGRGWQFPQGGVRTGETIEAAAFRELHEEIGISVADVRLIGQTRDWLRYRLPSRYVRRNRLPRCIGQKQRWFLLQLVRHDSGFDFARTTDPEFDHYRWANYWEPAREVIFFKRAVYVQALSELAPLAFGGAPPPYPAWWGDFVANELDPTRSAAASID